MESWWSGTNVIPGRTSELSRNHNAPPPPDHTKKKQLMGLLTEFKKKMQQTKLHACHLVHVKVPVNPLLLKHNTAQLRWVRKLHQHDQKKRRAYHKTIPVVFASRLLQIGDNQGLTPMILATTSTRCGILKLLIRMAFFKAGR